MKKFNSYARKFFNYLFITSLLLIGILGSVEIFTYTYELSSSIILENESRDENSIVNEFTITVNPGASLTDIATMLQERGFIKSKLLFLGQGYLYDYHNKLQPGTYTLKNTYDNVTILDTLTPAPVVETLRLTIPEGYTITDIAATVASLGICSEEEFIVAANDVSAYNFDFLQAIPEGIAYPLEGYLFPETYFITEDTSPESIVRMMLTQFDRVSSKYRQYLLDSPYDLHDIVTIASIIEGEARVPQERATISGVIYNRLDSNMSLQMCSTVQYSLENRKDVLTYEDLEIDTPYNTYLYPNLPIGPISAPGEAALEAAFLPENHDYYFFVLKDSSTGSHAFSSTGSEHNANKQKYQSTNDINFRDY